MENGIVVLHVTVPANIIDAHITINADYAPRAKIPGMLAIISTQGDYDKLKSASIDSTGDIWISLVSSFAYAERIIFMYPLQKK